MGIATRSSSGKLRKPRLRADDFALTNHRRADCRSWVALPIALMLILGGAVAAAEPIPAPSVSQGSEASAGAPCRAKDPHDILVCGERRQAYRLDPVVMEASRKAEANNRSAIAPMPPAQAVCARAPSGCGAGLEGLDLANVAIVAGTMAVRAADGKDWTSPLRPGGPDEYELYKQARRRRQAEETERAAARVKRRAEEALGKRPSANSRPK
jgi:hypothetical protein